jgi:8-oxo-dGTP pyrophosphatase MutT (NUDIX family)
MAVADPVYAAVRAHVVEGARVLLGEKRSRPGVWTTVGGKPEPGETPEETLKREVREELGIEVTACRRLPDREHTQEGRPGRVAIFAVSGWTGTPQNCAPKEHAGVRWFTRGELDSITLTDDARAEALGLIASQKEGT